MVGGDGRACARVGSRGPAARRSMSHRWHQTSVRVFFPRGEECVNEFPRVSRLKLFSYAVAALSNFFGPPSGSHGSSPGVNCRTVTVAGVRVRNTDAEGARTLSGRAGGHKVIGPGPISAIVLNGPRYVAAHVAPCSESLDTVRYRSVAVSVRTLVMVQTLITDRRTSAQIISHGPAIIGWGASPKARRVRVSVRVRTDPRESRHISMAPP